MSVQMFDPSNYDPQFLAALVYVAELPDGHSEMRTTAHDLPKLYPGDPLAAAVFASFARYELQDDDSNRRAAQMMRDNIESSQFVGASAVLLINNLFFLEDERPFAEYRTIAQQAVSAEPDWPRPWWFLGWTHPEESAEKRDAFDRASTLLLKDSSGFSREQIAFEDLFTGRLDPAPER